MKTKPSPLAGRKQSPETIAKRIATMKAKRAMREQSSQVTAVVVRRKNAMPMPDAGDISDAIHTLRRFRKIAKRENPDPEDLALLGMLALRMLEGGLK
jgi:hypothetical protein